MILAKKFNRNIFALFFNIYDAFTKDLFFHLKFNVRLFKLINVFIPCANSLASSTPIELELNFCY
jgi:hypothetical protein